MDAPVEERVQTSVPYRLWYCPEFPLAQLGGKLDKDIEEMPWIMGLLDDIRRSGELRNPVIVWNHHAHRLTGKQPMWLLRAGSNRTWCVEQLGWLTLPAVVSTAPDERPANMPYREIAPVEVQTYFQDGGMIWANDHGFGLQMAKKPEITYAEYEANSAEIADITPTNHRRSKIINPMLGDKDASK